MTATLWAQLVLHVDADHTRLLEVLHHVINRNSVAVAGIGIGHDGDRDAARNMPTGVHILTQTEQANVRLTDQ